MLDKDEREPMTIESFDPIDYQTQLEEKGYSTETARMLTEKKKEELMNKIESNFEYVMKLEKIEDEIDDDDENDLVIIGIASTGNLDHDYERIDMDSLRAQWDRYMQNPIVRYMHGKDVRNPDAIGKVIPEYTNSKGNTYKTKFTENGPFVVVKISNADDVKPIRTKIKEGILKGFSIGGRADRVKQFDHSLGKDINRVIVKRLSEISVVDLPANPEGIFEVIEKACSGPNCPLLKNETKSNKIWQVRYANGKAIQNFEDEKDADYFIETSKKENNKLFDFNNKKLIDRKNIKDKIHPKNEKITFKIEIDLDEL